VKEKNKRVESVKNARRKMQFINAHDARFVLVLWNAAEDINSAQLAPESEIVVPFFQSVK